jgi:hypothetical protein
VVDPQSRQENVMRRNPVWIGAVMVLCSRLLASDTPAGELAPLSAIELQQRCRAYLEDAQSADGRSCSAYIRGFLEGSLLVRVSDPNDGQRSRESFSERAYRTRLGIRRTQPPLYCVDSTVSLSQFVTRVLDEAAVHPPGPETSASEVLIRTLGRSYRCRG